MKKVSLQPKRLSSIGLNPASPGEKYVGGIIAQNGRNFYQKLSQKWILVQGAAAANIKPEEYIRYFEDLI
jgi:hypothetical protein